MNDTHTTEYGVTVSGDQWDRQKFRETIGELEGVAISSESEENTIYVVIEDGVDEMSRVLRVFDNPGAAESYVDDPDNAGHLFVEQLEVESEYSQ